MDNLVMIPKKEEGQSIIDNVSLESVQKTLVKINNFHQIVRATLKKDIDYGLIPGAKKPMLFKSGAENILLLFGFATSIEVMDAIPVQLTRDTNFISYTIKSRLLKNGEVVSEGIGTCNSQEKKYIDQEALNIANTIMKMAKKRALVDAVLHVAGLSAIFAQEAEDIDDYLKKETLENLSTSDAASTKINFGKHKGKTAGEIYKSDPQYIQWFFANGRDEKIKKAFEVLSDAVKQQANKATNRVDEDTPIEGVTHVGEQLFDYDIDSDNNDN